MLRKNRRFSRAEGNARRDSLKMLHRLLAKTFGVTSGAAFLSVLSVDPRFPRFKKPALPRYLWPKLGQYIIEQANMASQQRGPEMLKQRKNINLMKNRNITLTTILLAFGIVALSQIAQAVVPAPDGGYPEVTRRREPTPF